MVKDSGNRKKFETGAVRDIYEGKGRCDLLPLDIISELITEWNTRKKSTKHQAILPLAHIDKFQKTGQYINLIYAVISFVDSGEFDNNIYTTIIEYSKQLEDGSKKYDDRNWQKGIPVKNYIDSAVRHYLKYCRKDTDERHDRAFVWNCLCGAWTVKYCNELNEYPLKEYKKT